MFPELQKKLTALYTFTTALILTFILSITFLFDLSSRKNRQEALFQNHLFVLSSRLQTGSTFTDTDLAQMELKNQLLIRVEENDALFFFPGAYEARTERETLFSQAEEAAAKEGIYPDSHPVSSDLLQTEIFTLSGASHDSYLGTVLILRIPSGYRRLILLQDITENKRQLLGSALFYGLIDLLGIFLLFLTGKWFVDRSLRPLEETYQKQQDFVAAVSHELRSPLAVIRTAVGALEDAPQEQTHFLSMIKKECLRGSTLIKNLLLLSTADQKSWEMKKTDFEVDELLLHLFEIYEPLCLTKDAVLQLLLPEQPLPFVHADPEICKQVFTILLDNALTYGLMDPPDSERKLLLKASVSAADPLSSAPRPAFSRTNRRHKQNASSCVTISVIDHGPGIPDAEKSLIFDRFYRSDRSRNQKEHFGLGLSLAASLCNMQEIPIRVSDTPGGGSTFSVTVPAIGIIPKT